MICNMAVEEILGYDIDKILLKTKSSNYHME